MPEYVGSKFSDYTEESKTIMPQEVIEDRQDQMHVESSLYGINKPKRITIKAKISHD